MVGGTPAPTKTMKNEIAARYAALLLGEKSYAVVDELDVEFITTRSESQIQSWTKNKLYVVENDGLTEGWGGQSLKILGKDKHGRQLFRLWNAKDFRASGNLKKKRLAELDARIERKESRKTNVIQKLINSGVDSATANLMFPALSEDNINKLLK